MCINPRPPVPQKSAQSFEETLSHIMTPSAVLSTASPSRRTLLRPHLRRLARSGGLSLAISCLYGKLSLGKERPRLEAI